MTCPPNPAPDSLTFFHVIRFYLHSSVSKQILRWVSFLSLNKDGGPEQPGKAEPQLMVEVSSRDQAVGAKSREPSETWGR